jgi:hypothetical protein
MVKSTFSQLGKGNNVRGHIARYSSDNVYESRYIKLEVTFSQTQIFIIAIVY